MLNKPALYELMEYCDSKYTLAMVAAKRARNIIDRNPELATTAGINSVSIALQEVADNSLTWHSKRETLHNAPQQETAVRKTIAMTLDELSELEKDPELPE